MALTKSQVQSAYVTFFNRPADPVGLNFWMTNGSDMATLLASFSTSAEYTAQYAGKSSAQIVNTIYNNLFGRDAEPAGLLFWANALATGALTVASIANEISTNGAQGADRVAFDSKTDAAVAFTDALNDTSEILGYDGAASLTLARAYIASVTDVASLEAAIAPVALGASVTAVTDAGNVVAGQNYMLTAGIDTVPGTSGNDTVTGLVTGSLSALDGIDGLGGTDTLTVTDTANISVPASVVVKNIETATLTSGGTVAVDASGWTGLTKLTTSGFGDATVAAATTTATTVVASTLANGDVAVDGGSNVVVSASGTTTGTITVGGSAGTVSITNAITGASAAGAIAVTGGTSVTIAQSSSHAVATHGAVTVAGVDGTTSVSISATGSVVGATNNTVSVTGVADADSDDTITSISVTGATTVTTAHTNKLASLSLTGTSNNVTIDNGDVGATDANIALALALNGVTGGILDDDDLIETLAVTTSGAASTLANITDSVLTALTVDGSKVLTLTSTAGATTLATVTVKGTAGLTATVSQATVTAVDTSATTGTSTITLDATKATFTGGAGKDNVTTSAAAPTKAIALGAGDDSLTLASGTTAVTGAITGGDGTDTLSMVAADAVTASGTATFATKVSGFESLTLTGATGAQAVDVAALGNYTKITSSASAGTLTLNNAASGSTLTITGDTTGTGYVVAVKDAATGTADSLNLVLTKAGLLAAGSVTAASVETVNITTADTQTTPTNPLDTLTLAATSATSVVIGGNAGLNLSGVTNLALTNLDASGITKGAFTFTSGALTAAAAIKGSATGTNTVTFSAAVNGAVTYTGGTGNDVITASNGKNNVIDLGNGTNSVTGLGGNNTITGGTGADTVTLTTGNNVVSLGNGANAFTATTGNNTYTGGTGVDTISVGAGVNTITTGTGADVVTITTAGANVNTYTTITDAHAGMQLVFTDLGTETFVSAKISSLDVGTAVFQDYANAVVAGATQAAHQTNGAFGWFQFGGNTYLVEVKHDTTAGIAQTFVNGVDQIVKLTGLIDLSTATGGTTNILTLV